jgi:hypothetical protein
MPVTQEGVSHFLTCKHAGKHSKKKTRRKGRERITNFKKLRAMLKDEVEHLRQEVLRSQSYETHYLDGKLQALRATLEMMDALEPPGTS